jgi:uncharacterized LabA/DUF88 family protein
MTLSAQRVGIFVDAQNLYHSAKSIYDPEAMVDYRTMLEMAVDGRSLVRAIVYVIDIEGVDQRGFFEVLHRLGFEIRSKPARLLPDGSRKADWDMGIAMDTIALADKLDVTVLVSGDGDFVDLVRFLQARGVRVEVMAFRETTATMLKEAADVFRPLDDTVIHVRR